MPASAPPDASSKELVALKDGYRRSAQSRADLLRLLRLVVRPAAVASGERTHLVALVRAGARVVVADAWSA
ncbi:hypothetical protein ACH4ND_21880 [Streptomyces sp. NPDC017179]|uniref:hypothetical protein n=1 Tax=Streptomyces sp. NPDC017179 TaxID=3364979 RepID=UPI0037B67247